MDVWWNGLTHGNNNNMPNYLNTQTRTSFKKVRFPNRSYQESNPDPRRLTPTNLTAGPQRSSLKTMKTFSEHVS